MKSRKLLIIAVSVVVLIGGLYVYTRNVAFENPKNCAACHYMVPYFKSWETSTHNKVPCLKCHDYSPEAAVVGQFKFLAGTHSPRPLANIPDKNCLQSGCHEKRLVESKEIFTKRGISFDHKPHFAEMKRGIKLHCRSCHSDIVQGQHVKVSMNVCFLCHFKGVPHDQAVTGCPSCHGAPQSPIKVKGKTFSHEAALKAGLTCNRCHLAVTKGDGVTPKDQCFFCHVDRAEKYGEVQMLHDKHVAQKQIDCLWCHPKIEHGDIKMIATIPFL